MSWTAPTTRSTGDLITAAIWNTDLVDNLAYLKTQLNTVSQNTPANALGTVYQNTSGKIRIVAVTASNNSTSTGFYGGTAKVGATSSPATVVGNVQIRLTPSGNGEYCATWVFVVLPGYYYKMDTGGMALGTWTEWDLH